MTTALPFPKRSGKVRDVYDVGGVTQDALLIVASDRISAFDCIMPNGIPGKGRLLTAMSNFWFGHFAEVENHLIQTDVDRFPEPLRAYAEVLRGRSVLVRQTRVIPVECVARGYLTGSGWKEYREHGSICGIKLPAGLRQCGKLPSPIFTPATKAQTGHDENIDFATVVNRHGQVLAERLRDLTLSIYERAAQFAAGRGILIADTKFEFGLTPDGKLILIDEILTPDSSRFWPAEGYEAGRDQPSFDKQFMRNWLEAQPWDKNPPAPRLPDDVVEGTRSRYAEAFLRLTGQAMS